MSATVDGSSWSRFTRVPLLLQGFIVFSLIATILYLGGILAPTLHEAILPYTGWSGLSYYMVTMLFAYSAIFQGQRKMIDGVKTVLGLAVLFGALDTYRHTLGQGAGAPDFGNPYLIYNPYRPVITVALPAVWLFLFMSPIMRKWSKNA